MNLSLLSHIKYCLYFFIVMRRSSVSSVCVCVSPPSPDPGLLQVLPRSQRRPESHHPQRHHQDRPCDGETLQPPLLPVRSGGMSDHFTGGRGGVARAHKASSWIFLGNELGSVGSLRDRMVGCSAAPGRGGGNNLCVYFVSTRPLINITQVRAGGVAAPRHL